MTQARESWGTRFGFVMAAAGSAVGLGNIWKFPYMTGENGGGAFLLIYLGFVLFFGLSLLMAELVIGRTAQLNPVGAYRKLGGPAWVPVGLVGIGAGFLILSFYIVVAGWTVAYIFLMARGALDNPDAEALGNLFGNFVSNPYEPVMYAGLFMILTAAVVAGGIGSGVERASKLFMPLLFVILLVLVGRSVTLPGAGEGLSFFLTPEWDKVTGKTVIAAIGQAFFSLSLGMGAMITYGSYMPKHHNLPADATMVAGLDTLVAILAGLLILPAVFSAGLNPSSGPGLTFITLPAVFAAMPGGMWFGLLFFILLAIAALTSAVSLLETVVTWLIDERRMSRLRATIGSASIIFLLGIPSSLAMGPWSEFKIYGKDILSFVDFVTSSILMPLGALAMALFVGWYMGQKAVIAITNDGTLRVPMIRLWLFMLRFVCPIGILVVLYNGLVA